MKKTLAFCLTLAMILSLFSGLVFSSAATQDDVKLKFEYAKALANYGVGLEDGGALTGDVIFDGVWAYEYMDLTGEKPVFKPMGCYRETAVMTAVHRWVGIYTATVDAVMKKDDPYNYCCFGYKGTRIHPGLGASPCLAFIFPYSGTINLNAAISAYSSPNNPERMPVSYGSIIEVWYNEVKIWPEQGSPEQRAWYHGAGGTCYIDITELNVRKGDRIRITATCAKDENGVPVKTGKGTDFTTMPVVTYTYVDDGNPIGHKDYTPVNINASDVSEEGFSVSWNQEYIAASYRVYVYSYSSEQPIKVLPVEEPTVHVSDLPDETAYKVCVSSVFSDGTESSQSLPINVRMGSEETSDTSSEETSTTDDVTTSSDILVPTTSDVPELPAENSFPLWLVAVGAIAVLAVIVVVLLCRKKK